MGKINKILVNNQTKSEEITLPSVNKLSVVAKANSLHLSSFGGMPILKEEEKRLALASQLMLQPTYSCTLSVRTA